MVTEYVRVTATSGTIIDCVITNRISVENYDNKILDHEMIEILMEDEIDTIRDEEYYANIF